jgi:ubiquinol-cytochrome c reductase cytochrome b subunit
MIWIILNNIILLTWIGACPVERPYILVGQILTVTYFLYYLRDAIISKKWEKKTIKI